ncbi:MAG: hypothetical protein J7L72_12645, partial [Candidatus Aminicenantes bacterium]|nr:hypothetical protein [Candidatus Aminicenantes bacterium]
LLRLPGPRLLKLSSLWRLRNYQNIYDILIPLFRGKEDLYSLRGTIPLTFWCSLFFGGCLLTGRVFCVYY